MSKSKWEEYADKAAEHAENAKFEEAAVYVDLARIARGPVTGQDEEGSYLP